MELREYAGGERWSNEGSKERVALKFYLAKAIALATPKPQSVPTYYLEFAKDLKPGDIVVTFNWDILLESVLNYVGTSYTYEWKIDTVQILKLHGSINWIEKPDPLRPWQPGSDYEPLGYETTRCRRKYILQFVFTTPIDGVLSGLWWMPFGRF